MKNIIKTVIILFVAMFSSHVFAEDEWRHGIGTGLFALNLDGDLGMNTTLFGPVQIDVDLSTSEISDVMETGLGVGGFSAKGKWKILYSLQYLELGDDISGNTTPGSIPVAAKATFTASGAEVAAIYQLAKKGKNIWGALGGLRYTKHEFDSTLTIGASTFTRNLDENWTDVLIGITHDRILSSKWSWNTRVDAGLGGSEGTLNVNTGASWGFADSWVASFYGKYTAQDYENGTKGDADWYLYDVNEFGLGATVLYLY